MDDEPHSSKRIRLDSSPSIDEIIQQPQLQDDVQSLEEDHCSICLHTKADTTVIPTCSHEFCFECILIWAEQSRKCPLCSQVIGDYLIHRIRSNYDYQKQFLPPLRTSPPPSAPPQVQGAHERPRNFPRRDRRWGQRARRASGEADQLERAIARRRWIYSHCLYAKHVASNSFTRYRPFPTPVQFASSPDLISRMTAFLRRELRVWPDLDIEFLTTFTISLMKSIDIRSESAIKLLAEFLDMDTQYVEGERHDNAEHFAHEIYCYLRSPFRDLNVYDSMVQYNIPADLALPVEPDRSHRWREGRASHSRTPDSSPGRSSLSPLQSPPSFINQEESHGFDEIYVASVTLSGNTGPRSTGREGPSSRREDFEDPNIRSHRSPRSDRASDRAHTPTEGGGTQTDAEEDTDGLQRARDKGKARERPAVQPGLCFGDELSHLVSRDPHLRAMDVSDKPVLKTRLTPKGEAVNNTDNTISAAATGSLNGDPIDNCPHAPSSGRGREQSAGSARLATDGRKPPRHSTLRQSVEAHLSRSGSAAAKTTQVNDRVAQLVAGNWHTRLRHGDEQPNRDPPLKLSPTQHNKPSLLARLSGPPPAADSNYRRRSARLSPHSNLEGLRHEDDPGPIPLFDEEEADADEHGIPVPTVMSQTPQQGTSLIQQQHGMSERLSTVRRSLSPPIATPVFPSGNSASFLVDESGSLGAHDGGTFLVDDNSLLPPPPPSSSPSQLDRRSHLREKLREERQRLGPHSKALSETRFNRVVPRQAPSPQSQAAGETAPLISAAVDSTELSCPVEARNEPGPPPLHSDGSPQQPPPLHASSGAAGSTTIIRGGDEQAASIGGRRPVMLEGTSGGTAHGGGGDGDAATLHREQALKASLVGRRT